MSSWFIFSANARGKSVLSVVCRERNNVWVIRGSRLRCDVCLRSGWNSGVDDEGTTRREERGEAWWSRAGARGMAKGRGGGRGAREIEGVLDGQDAPPACWFIPYNLLSHLIRLLVRGVGQRFAPMARRGQQRGAACYWNLVARERERGKRHRTIRRRCLISDLSRPSRRALKQCDEIPCIQDAV